MVAVLAIVQVEYDKFILVSRKDNDKDYGLIGGKVEVGENNYDAMVREVKEETGLDVTSAFVLDERMHDGYYTQCYYVTTFKYDDSENITLDQHINIFNKNSVNEGLVTLGSSELLIDPKMSFSSYNIDVIAKLKDYFENNSLYKSLKSKTLYGFMDELFPYNWGGIKSRIIETGVELVDESTPWLIGVSNINITKREGSSYLHTLLKTALFTAHDCFHNLWGLPYISDFSEKSLDAFKKAQMSGEIAVLVVTEFILAKQIQKRHPELTHAVSLRNAVPLVSYGEVLYQLAPRDLAGRLDEILHAKMNQLWVRESVFAKAFFDDYIPMLQKDRDNISLNWKIMKRDNFIPNASPTVRYSLRMSGTQLTQWMIDDFMHLRDSDEHIDEDIRQLNKERRKTMVIPSDWVY